MLSTTAVTKICKIFQLGSVMQKPVLMTGGLLHQLWSIETSSGKFVIKALNPQIINSDTALKQLYLTDEIARSMNNFGIRAGLSCQSEQGIIATIDQNHYMVFPWIDGVVLKPAAVTTQQSFTLGKILGEMHGINLQLPKLKPPQWQGFTKDHCQQLTTTAQQKNLKWAQHLNAALSELVAWSELAKKAAAKLNTLLVVSHRDLDNKNVLWQNQQSVPIIIDWEYAGLINPGLDLFIVALNWSGQTEHDADIKLFQAALKGYVTQQASLPMITMDTVYGYLGYAMDWLEFEMRRSLQENADLIEAEIIKTLAALRSVYNHREKLLSWVEEGGKQ